MKTKLGKYIVESDNLQFIVREKKTVQDGPNKGESYYPVIAYCCKFDEVLKFIPDKIIRSNNDVQQIITELEALRTDIQSLNEKPVIFVKADKSDAEDEVIGA